MVDWKQERGGVREVQTPKTPHSDPLPLARLHLQKYPELPKMALLAVDQDFNNELVKDRYVFLCLKIFLLKSQLSSLLLLI
jgi:hypothetical protein